MVKSEDKQTVKIGIIVVCYLSTDIKKD